MTVRATFTLTKKADIPTTQILRSNLKTYISDTDMLRHVECQTYSHLNNHLITVMHNATDEHKPYFYLLVGTTLKWLHYMDIQCINIEFEYED